MKRTWLVTVLITLLIAVISPAYLLGQDTKVSKAPGKTKTENIKKPQKTEDNVTPGEVPSGQKDKAVTNEKEKGFEKTGDTGKKEGWNQEKKTGVNKAGVAKDKKTREKEMKKARKDREEKARAAKKDREKKMKEKEKERAKAAKEKKEARKQLSK